MINRWLEEIADAKKREKDFFKAGENILRIYSGDEDVPFNILYSNTETLLPALFSQLPRPVIQRRFKDNDPMGKVISEVCQRMLEYLLDTDVENYDTFEASMTDATLDGLLPGRGITTIKYDAQISGEDDNEKVDWETVCTDSKKWDRVYFGYARKWNQVPWIAYEEYYDEKEAKEKFGKTDLKFTEGEETDDIKDVSENQDLGKKKTALIYQIWDKSDRKVKYISPQEKDKYLLIEDDPLNLINFFNCPKPLQFVRKSNDLKPTALYDLYENQAEELNRVQKRINRVVDAIKVRGVYDGNLGIELENLLKESDNALTPTDKAATLIEGGLDKAIWFLPIEKLIVVLQQLYVARESCKSVIYEITGISDIIRGQSKASETLGAQKIKETWGTMRLKRSQAETQRYALDTIKIMLEVAINQFSQETWQKVTMLPYPTDEEKQKAQQLLKQAQEQQLAQQQIAQQSGQPPQPLPPQMQQQLQQAQQVMQSPSWEDILKTLKDDFARSYRLDIETNSTLDVEATEDKQQVAEFMNAMAQFMNGIGPMVESKTLPFGAAKEMMLEIVRRYRFGREVEDQLKQMQEPQQKPNPEQQKQAQQLQQQAQKLEQEKQKLQQEAQKVEAEKQQLEFDRKLAQLEQKHREDLAQSGQRNTQVEMESEIKSMFVKQKSDLQSMMDKHESRITKNANVSS